MITRINSLKDQIKYQIEKLRVILARSTTSTCDVYQDSLTSSTEAMASLSQKVKKWFVIMLQVNLIFLKYSVLLE